MVHRILTWLSNGVDISQWDCLLSHFDLSFMIIDDLHVWFKVAGTEHVSGKEYINSSVSIKIKDIEGNFNCCYFLLYETKFLWKLNIL